MEYSKYIELIQVACKSVSPETVFRQGQSYQNIEFPEIATYGVLITPPVLSITTTNLENRQSRLMIIQHDSLENLDQEARTKIISDCEQFAKEFRQVLFDLDGGFVVRDSFRIQPLQLISSMQLTGVTVTFNIISSLTIQC
jgi:hypothetical protein